MQVSNLFQLPSVKYMGDTAPKVFSLLWFSGLKWSIQETVLILRMGCEKCG